MNTDIENIILEHDYSELTPNQLNVIQEWADNEEEYSTLQQILISAPTLIEDVTPSAELKSSLMETFHAKHASATVLGETSQNSAGNNKKVLFLRMKYVASIAALLLILFLIYPLIKTTYNEKDVTNNQVAKNEVSIKKEEQNSKKEEQITSQPEEIQTLRNVIESPIQVAQNQDVKDVSTRRNENDAPVELTERTRSFTADSEVHSSFNFANVPSATTTSLSNSGNITAMHSDRISIADLPESSRQVIHARPELLDLLHTSF